MFKKNKITSATIITTLTTALMVVVSTAASAHEGHGVNAVGHDLEHLLWLGLAAAVVLALLYKVFFSKKS